MVLAVESGGGLEEGVTVAEEVAGGVGAGADAEGEGEFGGEGAAGEAVPHLALAVEGVEAGLGGGVGERAGGSGLGGGDGVAHGGAGEGGDLGGVAGLAGMVGGEGEGRQEEAEAAEHAVTMIAGVGAGLKVCWGCGGGYGRGSGRTVGRSGG